MDGERLDHAERERRAADSAARKAERSGVAAMQRAVKLRAFEAVGDRRPIGMDRVGLGAQHLIGIEWRHDFPPGSWPGGLFTANRPHSTITTEPKAADSRITALRWHSRTRLGVGSPTAPPGARIMQTSNSQ